MSSKEDDNHTGRVKNSADTDRLPPKKRYKFSEEDESSCYGEKIKVEGDPTWNLVAGVIRHTSCPDHAVSYVFYSTRP